MGLYTIFKNELNETMTRHGFIHQSNVFIRILGNEIVQAVTVKPITDYEINAAIFPLYDPPYGLPENTKKPYWAEKISLKFNGYIDFPHTTKCVDLETNEVSYFLQPFLSKREEYVGYTVENLRKVAEHMERTHIPMFDRIYDIESYLEWMTGDYRKYRTGFLKVGAHTMLHKAYLDGNFDWGLRYIEDYLVKRVGTWFRAHSWLYKAPKSEWENNPSYCEIKNDIDRYEERLKEEFFEFYKHYDSGDLSGIKEVIDSARARTVEILKKKYSKLKL